MSLRLPSLALGLVAASSLTACRTTGEPGSVQRPLGLRLTNDIGTLHEDYTHGTELWMSQPAAEAPGWLEGLAGTWLFTALAAPLGTVDASPELRTHIAHTIYTPVDLEITTLQPRDRPYAGWLHAGLSVERTELDPDPERRHDRRTAIELDLGIVGPSALGEPIQKSWHDFWELQDINGWDHQLRDEPVLLLARRDDWRLGRTYVGDGREADAMAHLDWQAGNLRTGLEAGASLRLGSELPRDFGMRSAARSGAAGGGAHLFVDADLRLVAHDIFVDGNTWKDSHAREHESVVGQLALGFSLPLGPVRLRLSRTMRDEEFEGQHGSRGVWTLDLATSL